MKLFVQNENLNYGIIGEIVENYKQYTRHTISLTPDIAWSVSMYHLPDIEKFKTPLIVTLHHIDPLKLQNYYPIFKHINKMATAVICPNNLTLTYAKEYINKTIYNLPYWILDKRRKPSNIEQVEKLKKEVKKDNEIIIGYFQKDSRGLEPKLSKGPDNFLQIVSRLNKKHNIKILLSCYNRDYLIYNLEKENVKYSYYTNYPNINDLYDICDWYFITSRTEGGPQAILEAPFRGVKTLSTPVGMATEILPKDYICETIDDFILKFEQPIETLQIKQKILDHYTSEILIPKYDNLLEEIWKQSN